MLINVELLPQGFEGSRTHNGGHDDVVLPR